ncbi:hypothetical protein JKF63_04910 [Porcisia hertigi]|uniref:Uncharacterized protein n=1 Tax=Porcisia hertigi TaxID=2761500 RepID=A0A836LHY6_9TRYP|nr:hypothetical protein JKF63_04910 [Porcisia hertigi]
MRLCTAHFYLTAPSAYPVLGCLCRRRRCMLLGNKAQGVWRGGSLVCAYEKECHQSSYSALAEGVSATSLCPDDDRSAAVSRASAAPEAASSSVAREAAVPGRGSPHGADAVAVLLSLNHTQRLLRRLPVGTSRLLFHYNELPSNIGEKMPAVVRQCQQQQQQQQHRPHPHPKGKGHPTNATAPMAASASEGMALTSAGTAPIGHLTASLSGGTDFSHLLTLAQPQLTASENTIFALFRAAQKERQLARLQWHKRQQSGLHMERPGQRSSTAAQGALPPFTDPLLFLRNLEEPCLLVPDTRDTFVSLGLAVDVHSTADTTTFSKCNGAPLASAASSPACASPASSPSTPSSGVGLAAHTASTPDTTVLDAFHLGLACSSTDYRTDYTSLPLHYVLGVPTALLDLLRPGPSMGGHTAQRGTHNAGVGDSGSRTWRLRCRTPVDLSRWLVFDTATSQVLLRRHGVPHTGEPSVSPTYLSTLEAQVFLAHTYSFDPRSAYEAAALQARVPAQPSTPATGSSASADASALPMARTTTQPLYSLFFFTVVRGQATGNSQVTPMDAGVLYPTYFFSYMSEVPTTQALAAKTATVAAQQFRLDSADDLKSSTSVSSGVFSGALDNSSLFVSMSGKRLRARVTDSSSRAAHLWTAQLQSGKLKPINSLATVSLSSPSVGRAEQRTSHYSLEAKSSISMVPGGGDSLRQNTVRQAIHKSFCIWREAVAARVPSPALRASTGTKVPAGDSGRSRAPPPVSDEPQRASASRHNPEPPRQIDRPTDSLPCSAALRGAGRKEGHRSRLEEQLDAESVALISDGGAFTQEWGSGSRFGRVAIAVATPLLLHAPERVAGAAAFPCPLSVAHRGKEGSGAEAAVDSTVRVTEAPLAEALWAALYTPEVVTAAPTSAFTSHSSSPLSATAVRAATEVTCVFPMAEDRLMFARERVLIPFLLHQPRWVLPVVDSPCASLSSSSPVSGTGHGQGAGSQRNGPIAVKVCPSLWRLDELEQLCGWRHPRFLFKDAFGSFSGLLTHDLYTIVGRKTPVMQAGQTNGQPTPPSPVVLFNDAAYVEAVLLPAMRRFSANTCTWVESGLCVYRSPCRVPTLEARCELEVDLTGDRNAKASSVSRLAPRWCRSEASYGDSLADSPVETAVEVALHHWQLSLWLQRLQRTPQRFLRRWLAACHGRTYFDAALDAEVRRGTGGAPVACLVFFVGSASSLPAKPPVSGASLIPHSESEDIGFGDCSDCSAVAASPEAIEGAVEKLLSLTPDRIAVVPLLDFVVWGALCSDFSAASVQHLTHAVDRCRATIDPSADGLAAVKYCMRFPQNLCCDGGRGMTVALLR